MRISRWKIVLLVLCCLALAFELWHFRVAPRSTPKQDAIRSQQMKPDFALLPESEIRAFANEFLGIPNTQVQSWEPTVREIDDLESNLTQISSLREKARNSNRHIDDPNRYFRQYLAIVHDGRKLIFINALCSIERAHSNDWQNHLIVVIDGGKCYWHATYDPLTLKFSDLIISGPA